MSGLSTLQAADLAFDPSRGQDRYALVDAAQCPGFVKAALRQAHAGSVEPVFSGGALDAAAPSGPWLVHAAGPLASLAWLAPWAAQMPAKPTMTFLQSPCTPLALASHLRDQLYTQDPDGQAWMLAWWDPQVLAALVGSPQDHTLLMPGPVLDPAQRASVLGPIERWVYLSAASHWQALDRGELTRQDQALAAPLLLTQAQLDQLARVNWVDELMRNVLEVLPDAAMDLPALRRQCLSVARQSTEHSMPTDVDTVLKQ